MTSYCSRSPTRWWGTHPRSGKLKIPTRVLKMHSPVVWDVLFRSIFCYLLLNHQHSLFWHCVFGRDTKFFWSSAIIHSSLDTRRITSQICSIRGGTWVIIGEMVMDISYGFQQACLMRKVCFIMRDRRLNCQMVELCIVSLLIVGMADKKSNQKDMQGQLCLIMNKLINYMHTWVYD